MIDILLLVLIELQLVTQVVFVVIALVGWQNTDTYFEMAAGFLASLLGVPLFLLLIGWAFYRYQTIERSKSRKAALAWSIFLALAGIGFALAVGGVSTVFSSSFSDKKLAELLKDTASASGNWYWYRLALFGIGSMLFAGLLIRKAARGPWGQPVSILNEGLDRKLNRIAERVVPNWSDHFLNRIDRLVRSGENDEAARLYRNETGVTWDEAHLKIETWPDSALECKLDAILKQLDDNRIKQNA
jgi:hypothetical protein